MDYNILLIPAGLMVIMILGATFSYLKDVFTNSNNKSPNNTNKKILDEINQNTGYNLKLKDVKK